MSRLLKLAPCQTPWVQATGFTVDLGVLEACAEVLGLGFKEAPLPTEEQLQAKEISYCKHAGTWAKRCALWRPDVGCMVNLI